jgi:hypothetical protein
MSDNGNSRGFQYFAKSPSGVEIALHLDIDPGKKPEEIADYCAAIDAAMAAKKFTRSDRLDKPAGGWGGKQRQERQETAPPDDLEVPVHCELKMVYIPAREATADRKAVAAHWDCREGKGCTDVRVVGDNRYPFTDWHLTKKKPAKAAAAAGTTPPAAAPMNGAAEKPMAYMDFLTIAYKEHKLTKTAVLKFAQKTDAELEALGPGGWADQLDKMKVAKVQA